MKPPNYPETKSSGIQWIGELPTHWETIPLKYVTQFVNGMAFKPDDWSHEGVPIIRIENLNGGEEFNYFEGETLPRYHVEKGDLLFGWSGNRGTSFGPFDWPREGLHYLNQHIFRLTGYECDKRWFFWTLKALTKTIEDEAHGIIGMVHITKGDLGALKIPQIPIPEQQQIAAFLDWKTGQIDALIARKQELLEKLKEKRLAVITQAVTKGLNPAAPMRDSGILWLGQVPAHWTVKRLRFAVGGLEQGWSPQCDNQPSEDGSWGVMKVGCVNGNEFNALENKALPPDIEPKKHYELKPGDILISRANTKELLGSAAIVPANVRPRLLLCDKLYRITRLLDMEIDFLTYYLRTPVARYQYERESTGASDSMQNIGQDTIKNLVVVLPPIDEQKQICQEICKRALQLEMMSTAVRQAIDRLTEYRTALITAATTGKIDVRGVQIPQPQ